MRDSNQRQVKRSKEQFKLSFNSMGNNFSYFNPYNLQQYQRKDHKIIQQNSPGPGNYEISLPFVKPKYSTIIKNADAVILKIFDNIHGTSPFKNKEDRFKLKQVCQPGPGQYSKSHRMSSEIREKKKNQLLQQKQIYRLRRKQIISALLKQQKVQSIKNYSINEISLQTQQFIQMKIGQYNQHILLRSHRYQNPLPLSPRKKYIPLHNDLNNKLKLQKQQQGVFTLSMRKSVDPYVDGRVGITQKKTRMSIDSQIKMTNTFYNRQLLDVILGRKQQRENIKKSMSRLNISQKSYENQEDQQQQSNYQQLHNQMQDQQEKQTSS